MNQRAIPGEYDGMDEDGAVMECYERSDPDMEDYLRMRHDHQCETIREVLLNP